MEKIIILLSLINTDTLYLSLPQAIDMLKKNNLIIKTINLQTKATYYQKQETKSIFLPNLNFNLAYQYQNIQPTMKSYVIDSFIPTPGGNFIPVYREIELKMGSKDQYMAQLKLQQPLWTWGKLIYTYLISKTNYNLQKIRQKQTEEELIYTLMQIYILTLVAEEYYKLTLKIDTELMENYKTAKTRYKNGYASDIELMQAEVQYKNNRKNINDARTQLSNLKSILKNLLNIPQQKEIILTTRLTREIDTTFEIKNINYTLKQLEYQKEILTYQREIYKRQYFPDIAGFITYTYQKPFWFEDKWKGYWTFGIGLNFNIFDGLKNYNKTKELSCQIKSLEFIIKNKQNEIERNIQQKKQEFKNALENLKIAEENLKLAERYYKMAKKQYKSGYINYLEFLQAEVNYFAQQTSYLKTLANAHISKIELEKALKGLNLTEGGF